MIEFLRADDLDAAFAVDPRHYLAGNLQRPQALAHIHDSQIEVGMTRYTAFTVATPHYHRVATEYAYVLAGEAKYMHIEEWREYHFRAGDFFVIRPGTTIVQKSQPGSAFLAFKTPGGNDKVSVELPSRLAEWVRGWDVPFV